MISQRYDIHMDQGADFELAITYTESDGSVIDLTSDNYAATLTIKEDVSDTSSLWAGTSADGNITLASTAPNLSVLIPYGTTEDFTFNKAVYDIELSKQVAGQALTKDRLIKGKVKLIKEVTS